MKNIQIKKAVAFFAAAIILSLIFPVVTGGAGLVDIIFRCAMTVLLGVGIVYLIYWAMDKLGL